MSTKKTNRAAGRSKKAAVRGGRVPRGTTKAAKTDLGARSRKVGRAASTTSGLKVGGGQETSHPKNAGKGKRGEQIEFIARGCLLHGSRVLVCRNLKHGYTYLPGGHVEFTESAAEALAREFLEECDVPVRVGELALISEGTFQTKKRWHHEMNLVFHVERQGSWPKMAFAGGGNGSTSKAASRSTSRRNSQLEADRSDALPVVTSREDAISFEWVDLAAMPDLDVRPQAVKAWLASLGNSDVGQCEWVSEIVPTR